MIEGVPPPENQPQPGPLLPEAAPEPPARLSPFAPPDPEGDAMTRERLRRMTLASLRTRRQRIDRRLHELGVAIGEQALRIPSVRGSGLVDLDRILRKVDGLDRAREERALERQADAGEGFVGQLSQDLGWLTEAFEAREVRTRRSLLVSELGLALAACDQRVLGEYAPHVRRLLDQHVQTARRIDELFVQARFFDEEFELRRTEGSLDEPPKPIERALARALDSVDTASSKVGDAIVDLGKSAAKTAAKGSGQAAWALARGAAKGAWNLGAMGIKRATSPGAPAEAGEDDAPEAEPEAAPRVEAAAPARPREDIPELIRKLAKLRDDGILNEKEFQRKKAELLERL